jgi:type IX secretion system substrate protein/NHL repeat-containing protein
MAGSFAGNAQTIITIAGGGSCGYSSCGDGGPATLAELYLPSGVVEDAAGNLLIADYYNHEIRRVDASTGYISTICGSIFSGLVGDGGPASLAELYEPYGISIDNTGNILIGDQGNSVVRAINTAGIIYRVAGTGAWGYSGDGGPAIAAKCFQPSGLKMDRQGNIIFAEGANNVIRKVNPAGIISTIAGNGSPGYWGDGGLAIYAYLNHPTDVAIDDTGNIYIADGDNNVIRKLDTSGHISTFAGTGSPGYSGDGGSATLATLRKQYGIARDGVGNFYVADGDNFAVRKIDLSGKIKTICGTGVSGYSGDGGPATAAQLSTTLGVYVDVNGCILICDSHTAVIRKIANDRPRFSAGNVQPVYFCGDTVTSVNLNSRLAVSDTDHGQTETWHVITGPAHGLLTGAYSTTSTGGLLTPTGYVYTHATGYYGTDTIRISVNDGIVLDTTTFVFYIDSLGAGSISGPASVCVGSSITISDIVPDGLWGSGSSFASISLTGIVTGIAAGTEPISYTVTNTCGTAVTVTTVTVNPLPDAGTISGMDSVCPGDTIVLADNITGGTWSSGSGHVSVDPASGMVVGVSSGPDLVRYTTTNASCSATAKFPVTVVSAAICTEGIRSPANMRSATITIYPNPNNGSFTVELPNTNESATITITDIFGKTVAMVSANQKVNSFTLTNLAKGTYLVKVLSATASSIRYMEIE